MNERYLAFRKWCPTGTNWEYMAFITNRKVEFTGQPACFGHINDQEAFSMYIHDWVTENTTSRPS